MNADGRRQLTVVDGGEQPRRPRSRASSGGRRLFARCLNDPADIDRLQNMFLIIFSPSALARVRTDAGDRRRSPDSSRRACHDWRVYLRPCN